MRFLTPLFVMLALFTACDKEDNTRNLEELLLTNGKITLNYGETTPLNDAIQVRFDEVIEESRCPLNAVCAWEGRAVVRILFIEADVTTELELIKQEGHPERALGEYGDLQIELVTVDPHAEAGVVVAFEDYFIVLGIE